MIKPVKVLYEIHPHILGGTERFLFRFLGQLDRSKYEPIVISSRNGPPLQMIRLADVRTEVLRDYFRMSGVQLADFIRQNGVALTQSNYYSAHLAMASNLALVPHLWRLGGHLDFASGSRSNQNTRSKLEIIRLLSTAIICNSRYVRSQFPRGAVHPLIQVIPNGISAPARAIEKKSRGVFRVGMIAHFAPQKRHLDFVRAAEIVCDKRDDVAFSIVGGNYADSATRRYADSVKRNAKNLQRQRKLSISEFVDPENSVVSSFDIVVLPSLCESFSNAILEAMAAGIPVIAARSGGNPELVEHEKTGILTPPMRPTAIADALLRMMHQPKLIDRMGRAARRKAQIHFSLQRCVKSYEKVYSKVLLNTRNTFSG